VIANGGVRLHIGKGLDKKAVVAGNRSRDFLANLEVCFSCLGKGLDNKGEGTISNIIEMVEGCISADADIISMSFVPSGSGGYSSSFNAILDAAYSRYNILLVAAGTFMNCGTLNRTKYESYRS